jgi:hypothetical protein
MAPLSQAGQMVGQMRSTVNYDFTNYFSMVKVTWHAYMLRD